jgi:hypothetical protein
MLREIFTILFAGKIQIRTADLCITGMMPKSRAGTYGSLA